MSKKIRVKLVRGLIASPKKLREVVRGLGLRKVNDERVLEDTPAIRGMIRKASHLVQMESV